jgi:hypothetical protein
LAAKSPLASPSFTGNVVTQGVNPTITIQDSDEAGDGFIKFKTANGTQRGYIQTAMTSDVMIFGTGTTERMRLISSGGLTFNGDTAAANALDDYEEGTWTPTFIGSSGNPTVNYAAQNGKYTKVGNIVTLSLQMNTNSVSGGSSSSKLRISGIPFDSNGAAGGRFGNFQNWNSSLNQSIGCFVNGTYLAVFWKQNIPVYTSQLRTSGDSNQMWFDTTYRVL